MLQPLRGMTYRFIIPEALPGLCAAAPCLSFQPATSGSADVTYRFIIPEALPGLCAAAPTGQALNIGDCSLIELAQLILPYYI